MPDVTPQPGTPLEFSWRVHWQGQAQRLPPGAHVTQTRTGYGYTKSPQPKQRHKMLIDFVGPALASTDQAQNLQGPVEAVATASTNARVVRVHAYPNPARKGWRATLEFDRVDAKQAVELRVFLRQGANTVSETWSYALAPE